MIIKNEKFWNGKYEEGKDYTDLTPGQTEIIFSDLNSDSKLLDVGCGTGKLLKIAEEKGVKSYGIELSEVAISKAKERGVKSEMICLDTEKIEEYKTDIKFNKIVLKLVIAFIQNKVNLLNWIQEHLENSGELIIITPISNDEGQFKIPGIAVEQLDFENLLAQVFGKFEIGDIIETPNGKIYTYLVSFEA